MYEIAVKTISLARESRRRRAATVRAWLYKGMLSVVTAGSVLVSGCQGDVETVWTAQVRSPDEKWIAIGRTDQHGGPGTAAVVTGVFLAPARDPRDQHLILNFFDGRPDQGGVRLKMEWLTPSHLQVSFSQHPDFNFQVVRYGDIDISVRDVATPTAGGGS
jgi:hypothetical protein